MNHPPIAHPRLIRNADGSGNGRAYAWKIQQMNRIPVTSRSRSSTTDVVRFSVSMRCASARLIVLGSSSHEPSRWAAHHEPATSTAYATTLTRSAARSTAARAYHPLEVRPHVGG